MPQKLPIHKNKAHAVDVLWWKPFFDAQEKLNRAVNRLSSPFFPSNVKIEEEGLFEQFQQNIHRLFSESFNTRQMFTPWWMGRHTEPYIDILEDDKGYKVYADVPGLGVSDLDVFAVDSALTIKGRKRYHRAENGRRYIHRECCEGPFSRTVALPEDANPEDASVTFDQNVLTIDVPKKGQAEPKTRKVKVVNAEQKSSGEKRKRAGKRKVRSATKTAQKRAA